MWPVSYRIGYQGETQSTQPCPPNILKMMQDIGIFKFWLSTLVKDCKLYYFGQRKWDLNKKWKIFTIESRFSFFSFSTSFTTASIWRIGSRCHASFSLKVGDRYIEDVHMNCMTTNCPKWSWNEREMNDPSCPSNVSQKNH